MGYLLNTYIEEEKKPIFIALQSVYGVGKKRAILVCLKFGIPKTAAFKDISVITKAKMLNYIKGTFVINNELKKQLIENQTQLLSINHYRGHRKNNNRPVRGQRTHTNAKTIRKMKF